MEHIPSTISLSSSPHLSLLGGMCMTTATDTREQHSQQQAGLNGLFRLLRCVLRENLFPWHSHEHDLYMASAKGKLLLKQPTFNSLDALQNYERLIWQDGNPYANQYDDQYKRQHDIVTDPVTALSKMLTLTEYVFEHDNDPWHRILNELENSQQNEALTIAFRQQQDQMILAQCRQHQLSNLLAWSRFRAQSLRCSNRSNNSDAANSAILIEQWAAVGHPYHPGSKTKLGLSESEVLNYAPEFGQPVPLILIAVHESLLKTTSLSPDLDYQNWFAMHYPDWHQEWQRCFFSDSTDGSHDLSHHYQPIPVHPWQHSHRLPLLFAEEIRLGLIKLKGPTFPTLATLSCRTLAPELNASQPYIKLPVAAQMTSSIRNLSTPSVDNATRIGAILQDILLQRPDIAQALRFQWDEVGLHTCVDTHAHDCEDTQERDNDRYLSVLFRRNVTKVLNDDEHGVVLAALFNISPLSDVPLFIELMQLAGVEQQSDAITWFSRYVTTLFTAVLDLYLEYGIALEAHQQNTLAVFTEKGDIRAFIHRDVGGVCINTERLSQQGWPVKFTESAILVNDQDAARVNLSHTVLQSHIGELIHLLEGYFDLTAETLWLLVSSLLESHLSNFASKYGQPLFEQEMDAFFRQPWPATAFIRMRLQNQSEHSCSQEIANPLTEGVFL
ncbi:hypothetical protein CBF23_009865 [Marinomonas agarivorans]|nr:hypothetical protein CBF23_009865 [Marinomonas agarivorans]